MNQRLAYFDRADRLKLFLFTAFPIHLWMILTGFQDLEYIIGLSSAWDGIGFFCYLLLYALIDSILLFILILVISLLTPPHWSKEFRFIWLSLLGFSLFGLSVIEQHLLFGLYVSIEFLQTNLPWLSYSLWVALIFSSVLLIVNGIISKLAIYRFQPIQTRIFSIFDKLATLTIFYLFLDVIAIAIIIIRNIQ